ncbi:TonB-dependent receptor [Sphingomonas sp.]|uniref:TonB-dependent receptor domain-containing protein n=1 Tax=Sphingomonas sp. TaxID=28214 RepID=UPI000DB6BCBA|nr:TonB-dependent receptor [Sphingomonas sp.]PZU07552.1 MAG: TonB-dependent receptor [Sphingomonas sp.]
MKGPIRSILMSGAAALGMSGSSVALAQQPAMAPAQTPAEQGPAVDADAAKEIIVTGSSIRGAPPVGSNLISIGQAQINATPAQSVQQVLKTVPAVVGLGSAGQGAFGSADGSGTNAPTIHGLGGSASNSTLILIDGHRFPLSGINHALGDPNIIPSIAIERVEVLPDGASSVYGSDAVAGVINFITRRRYDGIEANGQLGFGDHYRTYNGSLLAGKTWDTGSLLFAYSYSRRSALSAGDRDFTNLDHRAQGGSNFATFACQPATIQPTGSSLIYASPYTGAGVANAQANAFCDYSDYTDLIPREIRNNGMIRITQEVGDRLTLSADAVYSNRVNRQNVTRGSVTATVFNSGSQANPFYVGVPGSTATSETIRFNADELLGSGAYIEGRAEDFYAHGTAEYKVDDNWRVTLGATFGFDNSAQQNFGQICTSCAYLALNGTTNGTGSLTAASVPSTGLIVTRLPLTAATALDVWNPLATNRTSAAVRAALTDSTITQLARQTIQNGTLKVDGSLFTLPAGEVKAAAGGELLRYTLKQDITRPLNIGPASTGSSTTNLFYKRTVESAYLEVLVPLISPEMEVPAIRSLSANISGRYDHYSDFGTTKNPKFAANWEPFEGLKLRGNYAKSFVAPALTSRGSNAAGVTGESGYGNYTLGQINVPISAFPQVANIPGVSCSNGVCAIGTATITGVQVNGGNANLQPQKGQTYSFGGDFTPTFARGLRISVTYWHNQIKGGITAPIPSLAINSPDLYSLLTILPSAAELAAATAGLPQTSALPANQFFIYNYRQRNVLNLTVAGIDADVSYTRNTNIGRFTAGVAFTREIKFDQQIGSGPKFSVLNTTGFNTTFPSVKLQGRANIGWEYKDISFDAFLNHTGSYRNYSSSTLTPIVRSSAGVPIGGGDKVKSYNTLDLHIGYTLPQSFLSKAQIFVDANNVFDKEPPFYNVANGYDTFQANPIGRVITVGLRTKF